MVTLSGAMEVEVAESGKTRRRRDEYYTFAELQALFDTTSESWQAIEEFLKAFKSAGINPLSSFPVQQKNERTLESVAGRVLAQANAYEVRQSDPNSRFATFYDKRVETEFTCTENSVTYPGAEKMTKAQMRAMVELFLARGHDPSTPIRLDGAKRHEKVLFRAVLEEMNEARVGNNLPPLVGLGDDLMWRPKAAVRKAKNIDGFLPPIETADIPLSDRSVQWKEKKANEIIDELKSKTQQVHDILHKLNSFKVDASLNLDQLEEGLGDRKKALAGFEDELRSVKTLHLSFGDKSKDVNDVIMLFEEINRIKQNPANKIILADFPSKRQGLQDHLADTSSTYHDYKDGASNLQTRFRQMEEAIVTGAHAMISLDKIGSDIDRISDEYVQNVLLPIDLIKERGAVVEDIMRRYNSANIPKGIGSFSFKEGYREEDLRSMGRKPYDLLHKDMPRQREEAENAIKSVSGKVSDFANKTPCPPKLQELLDQELAEANNQIQRFSDRLESDRTDLLNVGARLSRAYHPQTPPTPSAPGGNIIEMQQRQTTDTHTPPAASAQRRVVNGYPPDEHVEDADAIAKQTQNKAPLNVVVAPTASAQATAPIATTTAISDSLTERLENMPYPTDNPNDPVTDSDDDGAKLMAARFASPSAAARQSAGQPIRPRQLASKANATWDADAFQAEQNRAAELSNKKLGVENIENDDPTEKEIQDSIERGNSCGRNISSGNRQFPACRP
jgi:hypothetical protein